MTPDDNVMEELPSQKIYNEFEERGKSCRSSRTGTECNPQVIGKVKGALEVWNSSAWGKDEKVASAIVRNYYYVCMMNGNNPSDNTPCQLFYYWLGEKVRGGKKPAQSFGVVMNSIYTALKEFPPMIKYKGKCKNLYPKISDALFEYRKTLFDYHYDCKDEQGRPRSKEPSSCQKCKGLLQAAKDAYDELEEWCRTGGEEYCTGFRANYKGGTTQYPKPEKLECTPEALPKPTRPEKCKKDVPSQEVYCQFDDADEHSCDANSGAAGVISTLKHKLEQYNISGSYENNIVGAYCKASKMEKGSGSNSDGCNFFYYWLENVMRTVNELDKKFGTYMEGIYEKLEQLRVDKRCTNLYERKNNISWKIFKQMKRLFDYQKDKSTILSGVGEGDPCPVQYQTYLKNVKCAYQTIQKKCTGGENSGREWCTQFGKWHANYKNETELKFGCVLNNPAQCTQEESSSESHESVVQPNSATYPVGTSTPTAPIISSAVAGVGLPTIVAFLLYKVSKITTIIITR
ncbi:Uncharacterized protein PCOAH_00018410 [Plasmodium coatneyi]|uniref:KIR protein n=1 Tax=Plasmodium coatneyi TaxID=208452 RepID=A0A1B1DWV2_9APIC|nr:Uncharacterized protein PCOAH_00018410 [Plasmodium coatneyi]ANQ07238.1 Uncharacterized protein PCOAH_00018410 [Plasmodium coatneyi]